MNVTKLLRDIAQIDKRFTWAIVEVPDDRRRELASCWNKPLSGSQFCSESKSEKFWLLPGEFHQLVEKLLVGARGRPVRFILL